MTDPSNTPTLTILGGPKAGTVFVLDEAVDNILVGADPACKFQIELPGVSPIHARLWVDAEGITVYDTNSPRGLYVNDDRVVGQAPIRNGDVLWLGAPGDPDVVMLQCRVPGRGAGAVAPSAEAAATTMALPSPAETVQTSVGEVETVYLAAPLAAPPSAEEVTEVVPEAAAEEAEVSEVVPEEAPTDFEVVEAPLEIQETQAFVPEPAAAVEEPEEEPQKFTVELPQVAPPAPPVVFEDETPPPAPAPPEAPSPAPRAEARPAARPAPPAAAPAPAPTPRPRPAPAKVERAAAAPAPPRPAAKAATPMGRYAALAAVGLIVVGGGIFAALRLMKPSAPAAPPPTAAAARPPATAAPPSTLAQPAEAPAAAPEATPEVPPPVEEAVTIVKPTAAPAKVAQAAPAAAPTPGPAKASAPPPTQAPAPAVPEGPAPEALKARQVTDLLAQADTALAAGNYDTATGLYDNALKLDPQNAPAAAGKAKAAERATALKKTFVPGRSSVQSGKAPKGGLGGFDTADVSVATPDYSGKIEYEASPAHVKAGDSYTVKVYFVNDGKKDFKIGGLTINTLVNGAKAAGGSAAPATREVGRGQRALIQEVPGTWPDGAKTWVLEVVVTSDHNDTVKSQLAWK